MHYIITIKLMDYLNPDFQDLAIINVTSRSYELQWNISAKCQALVQMSVTVNNVPTILSR